MRGHARKRPLSRENRNPLPFGLPRTEALLDKERGVEYEMMAIREEHDKLLEWVREDPGNLKHVIELLSSEGLGVAASAADALSLFIRNGIDITGSVPALEKALDNKAYAAENAATTLVLHHMANGDTGAITELQSHESKIVKKAVSEIIQQESKNGAA
jgi:hypothetical protein